MDFSTAAWLSILSIGFIFVSFLFERGIFYYEEDFQKDCKLLKLQYLFFGIGLLCCFLMVLQGLHLLIEGYKWDGSNISGAQLGKLAVKGKGGGAIFVLAYRLFQNYTPQMIIFGYGYIIWKYKDDLKDIYPIIFKTHEFIRPIIKKIKGNREAIASFEGSDENKIKIIEKLILPLPKWYKKALQKDLHIFKEEKIKDYQKLKEKGLMTEEELLAITRKFRGLDKFF